MKKAKVVLSLIVVLFIIGIMLFPSIKKSLSPKEDGLPGASKGQISNSQKPLNVNALVIKTETLNDLFLTKGSLIPDEEVNLSFETSGKIIKIYFEEGTTVSKGQLLAKVNDDPLQAELKKLLAQVPLAEDRVFRQKSLLAKDAVSKEAYEQVTTDLGTLNADIELVRARIAQTELRAPFDGIIGLRSVSEGQYASPSTVIAKLTKVVPLKVEFSINERQANEIRRGTRLSFNLTDDMNTYQATVYAVESTVDESTRTLMARATYPNANGRLKPGRLANISIQLNEIRNAITAPSESIIAEMGRDIAYIYKGGKAEVVELTKGLRTESKVQIIHGLSVGDTLITSGVMQLRNGMNVTINNIY